MENSSSPEYHFGKLGFYAKLVAFNESDHEKKRCEFIIELPKPIAS